MAKVSREEAAMAEGGPKRRFQMVSSKKIEYYTLDEVGQHNSTKDLWLIMNRRVYDVTKFHKFHPGGSAVMLQMAGKDATAVASAAHKTLLPGNIMKEFEIGYVRMSAKAERPKSQRLGGHLNETIQVNDLPKPEPRPIKFPVREKTKDAAAPTKPKAKQEDAPRVMSGCPPQGNESGLIRDLRSAKKVVDRSLRNVSGSLSKELSSGSLSKENLGEAKVPATRRKGSSSTLTPAPLKPHLSHEPAADHCGRSSVDIAPQPPPTSAVPELGGCSIILREHRFVGSAPAQMNVEASLACEGLVDAGVAEAVSVVNFLRPQVAKVRKSAWNVLRQELTGFVDVMEKTGSKPGAAWVLRALEDVVAFQQNDPSVAVAKLSDLLREDANRDGDVPKIVWDAAIGVIEAEKIADARQSLICCLEAFGGLSKGHSSAHDVRILASPEPEALEGMIQACEIEDAREVYLARRVLCWAVAPPSSWPHLVQSPTVLPTSLAGPKSPVGSVCGGSSSSGSARSQKKCWQNQIDLDAFKKPGVERANMQVPHATLSGREEVPQWVRRKGKRSSTPSPPPEISDSLGSPPLVKGSLLSNV